MRVLVLTHYFPEHGGGIEIVAGELATRLAKRGFTIEWLASSGPQPREPLPAGGVAVRAWNVCEQVFGFPFPLWGPAGVAELRRAVHECDVLHIHDSLYMGNVLGHAIARRAGKPVLLTQHVGIVPYRNPVLRATMEAANRLLAARVVRTSNLAVYCSLTTEKYFASRVGPDHRHAFIANGVDTQVFRPLGEDDRRQRRQSLGWSDDAIALLFVGRFVEKKGLGILRRLVGRFPAQHWVFAGWGPEDPSSWRATNVECLGKRTREELVRIYQAADLLVLPSTGEGFPLVVQEAMACGTPSLVSDEVADAYPGFREIGWHAQPAEAAFASVLSTLVSAPSLLQARRPEAAAFARQEWSWERCADRYAAELRRLYREVTTRAESA